MCFCGSEGTLIVDFYAKLIKVRRLGEEAVREIRPPSGGGGHAGGDEVIGRELAGVMLDGRPVACGGDEGLESAVVALSIEDSARSRSIVDLEPVWKGLNR